MHFSKALQPGLHIPLGLKKLSVCLKCKGKTSKSMLILNKNPFMKKNAYSCSIIILHWKRMKTSQEQNLEFQVIWCSLYHLLTKSILQEGETVFESNWITKHFFFFFPQDLVFSLQTACEGSSVRFSNRLSACLSHSLSPSQLCSTGWVSF